MRIQLSIGLGSTRVRRIDQRITPGNRWSALLQAGVTHRAARTARGVPPRSIICVSSCPAWGLPPDSQTARWLASKFLAHVPPPLRFEESTKAGCARGGGKVYPLCASRAGKISTAGSAAARCTTSTSTVRPCSPSTPLRPSRVAPGACNSRGTPSSARVRSCP